MLPPDTYASDVVLITGAEHVLARAAALEFARSGAAVAVVVTDKSTLDLEPLTSLGARALAHDTDICDDVSVTALFESIEAKLGPVTVLLNFTRCGDPGPAERLTLRQWRNVTQRITDGAFVCSTEFARRRIASSGPGAILNLADTTAWTGLPGMSHVAAAMGSLQAMTRSLAVEWAADGIRINAIAAGPFMGDDTPLYRQAQRENRTLAATLPALRVGAPQEFGWAAAFLCSPYAAYTTGGTFIIDGGSHLRRSISGPPFVSPRVWSSMAGSAAVIDNTGQSSASQR
jgi:NAD(P)-dependent dehydrogenase (short-subunit alcohol dehydrogenase family)